MVGACWVYVELVLRGVGAGRLEMYRGFEGGGFSRVEQCSGMVSWNAEDGGGIEG